MVYMYHSFLIHSSADGHVGCFHVLAIINSAAMNTGVHVTLTLNSQALFCCTNDVFLEREKKKGGGEKKETTI